MHRIITELIFYSHSPPVSPAAINYSGHHSEIVINKSVTNFSSTTVQAFVDTIQQYASDNLAKILVMIRDPYVQKIRREQAMTTTAFLANTGGLLGLCLGFSVISLAELVYHFLLKRY